ncbi:MAG TPA: hypothetical protein PKM25_13870 [Candidatus Ozemobacteraceae bacterium]|nr:hypothetical protein [Candidatus Ozemobacteraceae bacterium]
MRFRGLLSMPAGFILALIIVQTMYLPVFNLTYHDEPFLTPPLQAQTLRNLLWSYQLHFREYFSLVGMAVDKRLAFPAGRYLQMIPPDGEMKIDEFFDFLRQEGFGEQEIEALDKNPLPSAPLLKFIGSGSYRFPYPDPYRLPLAHLAQGTDLRSIYPALDVPLNDLNRPPFSNLAALPVIDTRGGSRLLSPGLLIRSLEEVERLRQSTRSTWIAMALLLFLTLVLGSLFAELLRRGGWVGYIAHSVCLITMAVGLFTILSPKFHRTRAIDFDPGTLSPSELTAMQPLAHALIDDLAGKGCINPGEVASLHTLINHPPID